MENRKRKNENEKLLKLLVILFLFAAPEGKTNEQRALGGNIAQQRQKLNCYFFKS